MTAFVPHDSNAMNKEGRFDQAIESSHVGYYEKESELQRDAMGRKVVISPNSNIDLNSVQLDVAPYSTVILNVNQIDHGTQRVITPSYQNVEIPK